MERWEGCGGNTFGGMMKKQKLNLPVFIWNHGVSFLRREFPYLPDLWKCSATEVFWHMFNHTFVLQYYSLLSHLHLTDAILPRHFLILNFFLMKYCQTSLPPFWYAKQTKSVLEFQNLCQARIADERHSSTFQSWAI